MKLLVKNTSSGLVPLYDTDFDERKKLKVGEVYLCQIARPRNYEFHKKFFALIRMAFHNLPEQLMEKCPNEDVLRKVLQVMAGHYELCYTLDGQEVISPKSISFSRMDNDEFQKLYSSVVDVTLKHIFIGSTLASVEDELVNFM